MAITKKLSFPMGNLVWGKNVEVNAGLAKPEEETTRPTTINKVITQAPQLPSGVLPVEKTIITHEDEKIVLILFLTDGFTKWFTFR